MYVSKPKLLPWPSFTPTSSQIPFKIQTRYWKKEKGSPLESSNEFYWNINFQWRTEGHRWTVNKLNLASYKIPGCQLLNKKLIYHAIDLGDCVKNAFKWSDLLVIWMCFFTATPTTTTKNRPPSTWKSKYQNYFSSPRSALKIFFKKVKPRESVTKFKLIFFCTCVTATSYISTYRYATEKKNQKCLF